MQLTIKNAKFLDDTIHDVFINKGKIIEILLPGEKDALGNVIDLYGKTYVSKGWIDLHTHAFSKFPPYCGNPDEIGYKRGVTTVVDAGSSGSNDIGEFYHLSNNFKTRIYAFINVSKIGLEQIDELSKIENLDYEGLRKAYQLYSDFIVGIKVRMSKSVVKEQGLIPLIKAKEFAKKLGLPVMVHVGNGPPAIKDILTQLERGDILTHCFHGKMNNLIESGQSTLDQVKKALARGVNLDIGHGTSSFSFDVAKKAQMLNISFHTISTDIYEHNQKNGPVYDLATTLTKFLYLGFDLKTVISSVTEIPAKIIGKSQLGIFEEGSIGDFTFFTLEEGEFPLKDSPGKVVIAPKRIVPKAVVIGGEYIEI